MITEEDWNTFIKKKSTKEAKLLSKKRSELAKKNVHPHTMGSSGYAAIIPKWEKDFQMTFTSIRPTGMQSRGGEKSSRQRSRKCTRRRGGKNKRNKRT